MKEILPAPARLEGEVVGVFAASQRLEYGDERFRERAGEGAGFPALRRLEGDRAACEIYEGHAEAGLAQSASCVDGDEEAEAHPFGLELDRLETKRYFLIGKLALLAWFVSGDPQSLQGGNGDLPAKGTLAQNEAEQLELVQGGVFGGQLVAGTAPGAPLHVGQAVPELDVPGMRDPFDRHPMTDVPPMQRIGGERLRALAMLAEPIVDPAPIVGLARGGFCALLSEGPLRADELGLGSLLLGLDEKLCGLHEPPAVLAVDDPPVGRPGSAVKGGHRSVTV